MLYDCYLFGYIIIIRSNVCKMASFYLKKVYNLRKPKCLYNFGCCNKFEN